MRSDLSSANIRILRRLQEWLAEILPGDPGANGAEPALVVEGFESEPWASLTFTGSKHVIELRLSGEREEIRRVVERLRCELADMDLGLAGHFLADAGITETACSVDKSGRTCLGLRLEALTIVE